MNLAEKWRNFVNSMNQKGIPVPTLRDPQTMRGSVSFTMVAVSFGLMVICVIMAVALVVNKWTGFFAAPTDSLNSLKEAFFMAFQMSGLSAGLYWGRKFQKDESGITVDVSEKPKSES